MDVVEEKLNNDVEAEDFDTSAASGTYNIGAKLIEARENQKLSSQDIAEQMNLTVSIINKIEANEFEQDIPIAFIRGYVRSYAQKVGIDVETLCAEFDRQTGHELAPVQKIKVVSDFKKRRREINSNSFIFKLITFVILVVLFALGGWELWKRLGQSKSDEPVVNELPLTSLSQPTQQTSVNDSPVVSDSSNLVENQVSQSETTANAPPVSDSTIKELQSDSPIVVDTETQTSDTTLASETTSEPSNSNDSAVSTEMENQLSQDFTESAPVEIKTGPIEELVFVFTDDCWVRVTDANGEVMAVGLKKSGKVMPIEGVTPINVTLGEPTAVTLEFKGESYDLSRFRAGRTARFVLE